MNRIHSGERIHKTNLFVTGVFYIIAAVASIIALKLYAPILYRPDYLVEGAPNAHRITLGAFFELVVVCTVSGTGVWGLLFAIPIFVYEMTLALWLIFKGLNPEVLSLRLDS